MPYLLDTSICIFFLRGKLDLDKILKEKGRENCFISEITIFELRFGAENSSDPLQSHIAVDDFINGLSIIPIYSCIMRYSKEKVRLRKIGKPINDEFDLLLGVSAVENNLTFVTDNLKDFQNIENIDLENWFIR